MIALPTLEPKLFTGTLKDLPWIHCVLFLTPILCIWMTGETPLVTSLTGVVITQSLWRYTTVWAPFVI
jgi:hypothetical protein